MKTKCDSDFHYLANLRFGSDGIVRWLKFWSLNRPKGANTFEMNLSDNSHGDEYEKQRIEEQTKITEKQLTDEIERLIRESDEKAKKLQIEKDIAEKNIHDEKLRRVAKINQPGFLISKDNQCKLWDANPQEGETVTWSGNCKNGFADGQGVAEWRYTLNKVDNYEREEGKFIEGEITSGNVRKLYRNGNIYEGGYLDHKAQGYGKFTRGDGKIIYEGMFSNGVPDGKGLLTKNDLYIESQEVLAREGCVWKFSGYDYNLVWYIGLDLSEAKCRLNYRPTN